METNRTSNITTREVGIAGNEATTWNDLIGSPSNAKLPAANDPTWTDITLDGFTTRALAFSVDDYLDIFVETSHDMKLNEAMEAHLHWTIATDDDGDEFAFEITGVAAGIGGTFTSLGTIASGDIVLSGNAGKHNYTDIGWLPAVNTTVSTIYIIRLTRVGVADGNETARIIYVLFQDNHVKSDTHGSLEEESKI